MDFTDDGFGGLMKVAHDYSSLNAESRAAQNDAKLNRSKIEALNFNTKFPENSPYTKGRTSANFKPDHHSVMGGKKAPFQANLKDTNIKFNHDSRNNQVGYNSSPKKVGGVEVELIKKAEANNQSQVKAMEYKNADRSIKTHLTQMQTLNND